MILTITPNYGGEQHLANVGSLREADDYLKSFCASRNLMRK